MIVSGFLLLGPLLSLSKTKGKEKHSHDWKKKKTHMIIPVFEFYDNNQHIH